MLFTKIPVKLTTKNGMRMLRKLIRTLVTLGLPFNKKIAYISLCLNGDDERRYMHSIKSTLMN